MDNDALAALEDMEPSDDGPEPEGVHGGQHTFEEILSRIEKIEAFLVDFGWE